MHTVHNFACMTAGNAPSRFKGQGSNFCRENVLRAKAGFQRENAHKGLMCPEVFRSL
jgi:hypothetical protein